MESRGLIAQRICCAGEIPRPRYLHHVPRTEIEQVFTRPPLVCIEVLSREDSFRSIRDRVDDYLRFGVPDIWIIDPATNRAYVCSRRGFQEPDGGVLEVPSSPIWIPLDDLFADLD
jgi:Uma2 family endonuclease